MSVNTMSLVFKARIQDIKIKDKKVTAPLLKLVLLALADHANDEGEGAYPSLITIEHKTALTHQSVLNTLRALKHEGFIIRSGISKRGTVNYSINLPMLRSLANQVDSPTSGRQPGLLPLANQVDSPSQPGLLEPSYNHPLTIPSREISKSEILEVISEANLVVDHELDLLRNQDQAYLDPFTEIERLFVQVFSEETGIKPFKGDISSWRKGIADLMAHLVTEEDLRTALHEMNRKGLTISWPGAALKSAIVVRAQRLKGKHTGNEVADTKRMLDQKWQGKPVPPPEDVLRAVKNLSRKLEAKDEHK